jgi:hypothetical protein
LFNWFEVMCRPVHRVSSSTELSSSQFAVLAESLEATFYDTALKKFTAQDFTDAGFVDGEIVFEQLT